MNAATSSMFPSHVGSIRSCGKSTCGLSPSCFFGFPSHVGSIRSERMP
jgi:hypothetical protein